MRPFLLLFCFALLLVSSPIIASTPQELQLAEKLYNQGIEHLKSRRTDRAIQSLSKAVQYAPSNGAVHWELGWAYWQNQDWDKVILHWQETQKYKPKQKDLHKYLALAKQYQQDNQAGDFNPEELQTSSNGEEFLITAVGDIMMGSNYRSEERLPPFDGSQLFAAVQDQLQGDIVFGNLEGALTDEEHSDKCKPSKKCYVFRTPQHYATNLKRSGFNLINLANNHSVDFGYKGLKDTISALNAEKLTYFGNMSKPTALVTVNGRKVGILGAGAFSCCLHVDQITKAKGFIHDLRKRGAELVIVSFHAGAEGLKAAHVPNGPEYFYGENRGDLRKFSHAMIDAGADLVLGHGPHTLRGLEIYNGKLIAYSLGNFLGYLGFNTSGHLKYTMILKVGFDKKGSLNSVQAVPIQLSDHVIPSPDPQGRAIPLLNRLSREDFGKNGLMLDPSGRWNP